MRPWLVRLFACGSVVAAFLVFEGCSSERQPSEGGAGDAAGDVDFWEVDVAPREACPAGEPFNGQPCDAPGLKCVVPCICAYKRGYRMYCSPTNQTWVVQVELCCEF